MPGAGVSSLCRFPSEPAACSAECANVSSLQSRPRWQSSPAPELLEARRTAPYDQDHLRSIEDRHILRVLNKQKDLGFEIFTDGELRRRNFMSDRLSRWIQQQLPDTLPPFEQFVCFSRLG